MNLKEIFTNIALIALIILGLMSVIVVTQNDNNVDNKVADNDLINKTYGNLLSNLSSVQSSAQVVSGNFENITPVSSFGEVEVTSIFSTTNTLKTLTVGLWNIYIVLPMAILGVPPVVAGVISSILILLIIIGVWAIWKGVTG